MLQSHMLQTDRSGFDRHDANASDGLGQIVQFALNFLRQQYAVILFVTLLALAAGVIYVRITPPTFTAQAKVLFGNPKNQFVQQQSVLAEPTIDASQIESQLQILQSKSIAKTVITQLKLYDDPDFTGAAPSPGNAWSSFKVRLGLESDKPAQPAQPPGDIPDALAEAFTKRLTAARVGLSKVIDISFSASNPARAAEITNAIAQAYITDQLNAKFDANKTATSWLQERLRELGQQALTAERAVDAFKKQNNIVAASGKLMDEQQVTELNSRLVAARALTSEATARLNRYHAILQASANGSLDKNIDAPLSEVLNSPIINGLRQQYLELTRREKDWASRYGRDHLAVVNLRTRTRDIRTSIMDEVRRLAETAQGDLDVAKQRQEEAEKQLAQAVAQSRTVNTAETTMRELETRAKGYRALYESFLQRYMGSVQQESFPISDIRIISPASPPLSKSKPKGIMILAMAGIGGIALGCGIGLLRTIMDRVFRTGSSLEAGLGLPCLSIVPLLKEADRPKIRRQAQSDDPGKRIIQTMPGIMSAATSMPLSRFAESIRAIKLGIDLNLTETSNKIVGITSTLPNEGKSTIAVSLAQLIAHAGKRVILVDCDLRNPTLSASLAPGTNAGLIEVISGARPLDDVVWRDPKTDLAFLPTAKKGSLLHTSEILSAEQTRKLFDRLRTAYDYIIVDLPPLAPVVDVRATTPLIDCYIMVVEWGKTRTDVVQHALHTAPNIYDTLIGTVLNKTDMSAMKRYDAYHNEYYNNKHYARYGYTE